MMFDCILYKNNLKIGKDNEKIINIFNKLTQEKENIGFQYELLERNVYNKEQKKKYGKLIFEKAIINEYLPALVLYVNDLLNSFKRYNSLLYPFEKKGANKKSRSCS